MSALYILWQWYSNKGPPFPSNPKSDQEALNQQLMGTGVLATTTQCQMAPPLPNGRHMGTKTKYLYVTSSAFPTIHPPSIPVHSKTDTILYLHTHICIGTNTIHIVSDNTERDSATVQRVAYYDTNIHCIVHCCECTDPPTPKRNCATCSVTNMCTFIFSLYHNT